MTLGRALGLASQKSLYWGQGFLITERAMVSLELDLTDAFVAYRLVLIPYGSSAVDLLEGYRSPVFRSCIC